MQAKGMPYSHTERGHPWHFDCQKRLVNLIYEEQEMGHERQSMTQAWHDLDRKELHDTRALLAAQSQP